MNTWLERIAVWAGRRPRRVFLIVGALVALSVVGALRLDLEPDIFGLLPPDRPVEEFREALETFGGTDMLLVVVRIPEEAPTEPYQELVDDLGSSLAELPELEYVEYRFAEPEALLRTLLPQGVLFLGPEERERLESRLGPDGLSKRAAELRQLLTAPQSMALKQLVLLDPLGLSQVFLERATASAGALSVDVGSGYYLSKDHRLLLLLAKPILPAQDFDFNRRLVSAVEERVAERVDDWEATIGAEHDLPRADVALGGGYVTALDDYALIWRDSVVNAVMAVGLVLALFLWAFRRFGPLLFAFLPLASGVAMAFGFAWLVQGTLSSATSGVAALLVGLGIDFVIVSYSRFVEERRSGSTVGRSIRVMGRTSFRAVLFGGITSAATFYAFLVTDFTGLRQMGVLAGTGILFCMAAVILLLPALLNWREQRYRRRDSRPTIFIHAFGTARLMRWSVQAPRATLVVGLVLTVALGLAATRLDFADSLKQMRAPGNRGIQVLEEVSVHFGTGFEFMSLIVHGDSFESVLELADEAARGAARLVDDGVLDGYDALAALVPPPSRQAASVSWLREHRSDLTDPELVVPRFEAALREEGLRPEAFAEGLGLLREALSVEAPADFESLGRSPETARALGRYVRRQGDEWVAVVKLFPPPRIWKREAPPDCHALAEELGPDVALTGVNVVSAHLRGKTKRQAITAAVLGIVLVAGLLWFDFRSWRDVGLALAPLVVGIVWMLGLMAVFGLTLNLLNIFVTTMIIGIGVDYGIHIVHRFREPVGGESFEVGVLETGKAITMAALSTTVGFGSMIVSSFPGLASIGYVAILGALSTALVAITILPAFLAWLDQGRSGVAS